MSSSEILPARPPNQSGLEVFLVKSYCPSQRSLSMKPIRRVKICWSTLPSLEVDNGRLVADIECSSRLALKLAGCDMFQGNYGNSYVNYSHRKFWSKAHIASFRDSNIRDEDLSYKWTYTKQEVPNPDEFLGKRVPEHDNVGDHPSYKHTITVSNNPDSVGASKILELDEISQANLGKSVVDLRVCMLILLDHEFELCYNHKYRTLSFSAVPRLGSARTELHFLKVKETMICVPSIKPDEIILSILNLAPFGPHNPQFEAQQPQGRIEDTLQVLLSSLEQKYIERATLVGFSGEWCYGSPEHKISRMLSIIAEKLEWWNPLSRLLLKPMLESIKNTQSIGKSSSAQGRYPYDDESSRPRHIMQLLETLELEESHVRELNELRVSLQQLLDLPHQGTYVKHLEVQINQSAKQTAIRRCKTTPVVSTASKASLNRLLTPEEMREYIQRVRDRLGWKFGGTSSSSQPNPSLIEEELDEGRPSIDDSEEPLMWTKHHSTFQVSESTANPTFTEPNVLKVRQISYEEALGRFRKLFCRTEDQIRRLQKVLNTDHTDPHLSLYLGFLRSAVKTAWATHIPINERFASRICKPLAQLDQVMKTCLHIGNSTFVGPFKLKSENADIPSAEDYREVDDLHFLKPIVGLGYKMPAIGRKRQICKFVLSYNRQMFIISKGIEEQFFSIYAWQSNQNEMDFICYYPVSELSPDNTKFVYHNGRIVEFVALTQICNMIILVDFTSYSTSTRRITFDVKQIPQNRISSLGTHRMYNFLPSIGDKYAHMLQFVDPGSVKLLSHKILPEGRIGGAKSKDITEILDNQWIGTLPLSFLYNSYCLWTFESHKMFILTSIMESGTPSMPESDKKSRTIYTYIFEMNSDCSLRSEVSVNRTELPPEGDFRNLLTSEPTNISQVSTSTTNTPPIAFPHFRHIMILVLSHPRSITLLSAQNGQTSLIRRVHISQTSLRALFSERGFDPLSCFRGCQNPATHLFRAKRLPDTKSAAAAGADRCTSKNNPPASCTSVCPDSAASNADDAHTHKSQRDHIRVRRLWIGRLAIRPF